MTNEPTPEVDLEKVAKENAERKKKREKERADDNARVLRNYNIKRRNPR